MNLASCNSEAIAIAPVSTVDQQIDRVKEQCNMLEELIVRLTGKLKPVLTPTFTMLDAAAAGATKAPTQSPLSDQIGCIAYTLEVNADAIRDLLDRLEV